MKNKKIVAIFLVCMLLLLSDISNSYAANKGAEFQYDGAHGQKPTIVIHDSSEKTLQDAYDIFKQAKKDNPNLEDDDFIWNYQIDDKEKTKAKKYVNSLKQKDVEKKKADTEKKKEETKKKASGEDKSANKNSKGYYQKKGAKEPYFEHTQANSTYGVKEAIKIYSTDPEVLKKAYESVQDKDNVIWQYDTGSDVGNAQAETQMEEFKNKDDEAKVAAEKQQLDQEDDSDDSTTAETKKGGKVDVDNPLKSVSDTNGKAIDFISKGKDAEKVNEADMEGKLSPAGQILVGIGIIVIMAVGAILGVKYMMSSGSAQDKAKMKERLIAYVVAVVLLFGGVGIYTLISSLIESIISG